MRELEELKHLAEQIILKIHQLERELRQKEISPKTEVSPSTEEAVPSGIPLQSAAVSPPPQKPKKPKPPRPKRDFEAFLGKHLMTLVGVVLMIVAIGFGLKWSSGLLEPITRVILSAIVASILLGLGEFFRRRVHLYFGYSLMGGGLAGYYFTVYAAHHNYHLIGLFAAVLGLIATTGLACGLSLVYDAKWLSVLGAFGGFLTPIFFKIQPEPYLLFSYVFLLNLGLLYISFHKSWRTLSVLGFIFTWSIFAAWEGRHFADEYFWITLLYINGSFLLYSLVPFAHQFLVDGQGRFKGVPFIITNTFLALGYNYHLITDLFSRKEVSFVTLGYAFCFLALAQYLFKKNLEDRPAFSVFLSMALFFVALTIPMAFSGLWIAVTWMLLGSALFWVGYRLGEWKILALACMVTLAGIGHLLIFDFQPLRFSGRKWWWFRKEVAPFGERLILYIAFVASLIVNARLYILQKVERKGLKDLGGLLWFLPIFFFFLFTNIEISAYCNAEAKKATLAALSIYWAVFTLGLMVAGVWQRLAALRYAALVLFLFSAFKVFFQDIPRYKGGPHLIVDLSVVGALLLVTAFLFIRFKDRKDEAGGV